ncbi:MAG: hypothetical protein IJV30_06745 [Oscillospiraceae bacterium]|nr:hypothetical protein [Oscillospiraceae bacterium]
MNGTEAETSVLRLGIIKKQNGWNVNSGLRRKAGIPVGIMERHLISDAEEMGTVLYRWSALFKTPTSCWRIDNPINGLNLEDRSVQTGRKSCNRLLQN